MIGSSTLDLVPPCGAYWANRSIGLLKLDEQRGQGGAGQFRVAGRDHECGHVVVVPGDLLRDGPADWQACRHDRGRGDDLGRAEREVQVLRVLPGLAEDPLQDTAARGGVLFGQRVEQVEGVVVIEGARSPCSHPGTVPRRL